MFVSEATAYSSEATFLFLLCPTSKTLDSAGKACQTQITLAYWVHSTLSITITSVVLLSFIMQSVAVFYCYSEDSYAECHYDECRYAKCRYAECHGVIIFSVNTT